ncbi:cytidylate kinase [Neoasaia chiangmaiensis NBRC 101099]|uniref:Cytidylate kinase n=1 Tax=Neoasaia chiangmaiensis TaxID=320497 RepID=A0A1U9KT51_9PROT|nr:(d)CMP kinase [Neoasaia chiangmaiensis]AQS89008.1 cytidylate kinase [Neoasaia chiangmaiensis]GBR40148.1 cytidylate kinase [Neoasaia chiangmaiensis NBRC 101099]GEN14035.1 cytidylate kinase [Neoasaia chiangmaiensis]
MALIIAVDGPAAAGKGTLAKALAAKLGLPHLDTGLLYRAVGRKMILCGLDPAVDDGAAVAAALEPGDLQRTDLRVPEIDQAASNVATQPAVRAALLQRQRDFAKALGGVIDGRDIGTVVFPDAPVKLFVTASARTRALRRHAQLHGDAPLSDEELVRLTSEITERDRKDASRAVSPLRCADDAVRIDTDCLNSAEVLEHALKIVGAR